MVLAPGAAAMRQPPGASLLDVCSVRGMRPTSPLTAHRVAKRIASYSDCALERETGAGDRRDKQLQLEMYGADARSGAPPAGTEKALDRESLVEEIDAQLVDGERRLHQLQALAKRSAGRGERARGVPKEDGDVVLGGM